MRASGLEAVEKAKTTDTDKVIDAIVGIEVPNLTGGTSKMLANHHITKPVLIGEIQDDGQFEVVWETSGLVLGDEWSGTEREEQQQARDDDSRACHSPSSTRRSPTALPTWSAWGGGRRRPRGRRRRSSNGCSRGTRCGAPRGGS